MANQQSTTVTRRAIMAGALTLPALSACAQTPPHRDKPVITSFSDNHVTIQADSWPGEMANAFCKLRGKSELLISRTDGGGFHFACLVMEDGGEEPLAFSAKVPGCIAWPAWAGHRASRVMTPEELALRYSNPRKLRYALRRLARYQAEQVLS